MPDVVISAATQVLAHVPSLARHGSKPRRELPKSEETAARFAAALRSFDAAAAYPPHQAWIGNVHPRDLPTRPWTDHQGAPARTGPFGEIMPEDEFLALLAAVDDFDLFALSDDAAQRGGAGLAAHPLAKAFDLDRIDKAIKDVDGVAAEPMALRLTDGAAMRCGQTDDESLSAHVLVDNLAAKATASLAMVHLLESSGIDPASIDYVIGCGEEAIGDRYQRGGGNLAKAVAQVAGLTNASGADVKNFCAAYVPALVMASSLVGAGVFQRVAIIAGGSLAKLGMKFQGHLSHDMPVMEDVLGGTACLVEADDGRSPKVRLDVVGRHRVSAGGSAAEVMKALAVEPLVNHGLAMDEVDDYATELHNPEITEPQGSGNVPERNYRTIAALAVQRGDIERADLPAFVTERGMPGFAPTQGHLASALCYVPHALERLTTNAFGHAGGGGADRVLLLAKGSLFLGRMCQLSDGMSVLLERNRPGGR